MGKRFLTKDEWRVGDLFERGIMRSSWWISIVARFWWSQTTLCSLVD